MTERLDFNEVALKKYYKTHYKLGSFMAILQLSRSMKMKVRYLLTPNSKRSTYAYKRPIPKDVQPFYQGKVNHWQKLGKDLTKAISEAEKLTKRYDKEYEVFRSPDSLVTLAAKEAALYGLELRKQEKVTYEMNDAGNKIEYLENHPNYERWLNDMTDQYAQYEATPEGYERTFKEALPHHQLMLDTFQGKNSHSLNKVETFILERTKKTTEKVAVSKRFKDFAPFTDTTHINRVKPEHFQAYLEALKKKGLKATSISTYISNLVGYLNKYWKATTSKPCPKWLRGVELPEIDEHGKPKVITPEHLIEIERVIREKAPNFLTQQLAGFLLGTGCRVNEIAGLRVEDVHLEEPIPYILILPNEARTVKTTAGRRFIPLTGIALDTAKQVMNKTHDSDYLFPSLIRNGQVTNSASTIVGKWIKGFNPLYTAHWFRHTLVARAKIFGYTADELNRLMGWGRRDKSGGMFDFYGNIANLPKSQEVFLNIETVKDYPIF